MIITIDGPSASGKSTVAKELATKLGFEYLDSGAMYRAIAWYCIENNINNSELVSKLTELEISLQNNGKVVHLNGQDVSKEIRSNIVSKKVSDIATIPAVRNKLTELQRKFAANHNIVIDGRDTGTVVFPDANLKIFMIASATVRAQRRHAELTQRGETIELETLIKEIEERDYKDSNRKEAPLIKAQDAIEINTDKLSINEVVELITNQVPSLNP